MATRCVTSSISSRVTEAVALSGNSQAKGKRSKRIEMHNDYLLIEKHDLRVGVASAIIGAIAGAAASELIHSVQHWQPWLLVAMSLLAGLTCVVTLGFVRAITTMFRTTQEAMTRFAGEITSVVTHQAHLIPRDLIYPEMADSIRNAKSEVAVITLFTYDWDSGRRNFLRPGDEPPGKDEFYDAIYACIEDRDVDYIRVWQVPPERKYIAKAAICEDDYYKTEMELIEKVSRDHPERARCVIAPALTTASYILVDRKTMFMNIDYYEPDERIWLSPYMLMVKDATTHTLDDLRRIVAHLTTPRN
jgi:hypothetical protein